MLLSIFKKWIPSRWGIFIWRISISIKNNHRLSFRTPSWPLQETMKLWGCVMWRKQNGCVISRLTKPGEFIYSLFSHQSCVDHTVNILIRVVMGEEVSLSLCPFVMSEWRRSTVWTWMITLWWWLLQMMVSSKCGKFILKRYAASWY